MCLILACHKLTTMQRQALITKAFLKLNLSRMKNSKIQNSKLNKKLKIMTMVLLGTKLKLNINKLMVKPIC